MKKLLAIVVVFAMIMLLVACSGSSSGQTTDTNKNTKETTDSPLGRDDKIDFQSIMSGNGSTNVVWGKQDAQTKADIIAEGAKVGLDVSFGNDGSMEIKDDEGNIMKQNPDGSWNIKTESGDHQVGGNWPDNNYTRMIPKPSFKLTAASTEEDEFSALFAEVTVEQVKSYVQEVKGRGFTIDENVTESNAAGYTIYAFEASNSNGYSISVTFSMGTMAISLTNDSID